jgi:hypothetical protein
MITALVNIFLAPTRTFQWLVDRDRRRQDALVPLGILVLAGILSMALLQDLFREHQFGLAVSRIENSTQLTEEQKDAALLKLEERFYHPTPVSKAIGWVSSALSIPLRVAFMALVMLGIGNMFFGGTATYGQLFSLAAFTYIINLLELAIKIPLMLNKWSIDVYTGLGLLDLGKPGSFVHAFLSGVDLFSFWRVVLLAIGMGVLYRRETKPFLWALLVFWLLQLTLFAGINAAYQ